MASRYRSISRPAINLLKSTIAKPSIKPVISVQSSPSVFTRPLSQMAALQSLLPLHSTIASARLISCLGADTMSSRSLSQELGLCVPR